MPYLSTRALIAPAVLLAASVWGTAVHAAGERPCSGAAAPSVQVVPRQGNPNLNRTPREQLTLVATISRPGEADGILDFRAGADLTLEANPTRGGCPVRLVQAVIQPTMLEMYLAKELEPGSCRFRAVYEHELMHVMLAQKAIDRSAVPLRRKLIAVLNALTADQARNVESVRAALGEAVREQLEALNEEYGLDNEALDTPEEGDRMARKCETPRAFVGDRLISDIGR